MPSLVDPKAPDGRGDDVVLLQRFATQCGVSLRNAGGVQYASPAPTGDVISPRHGGARRRPATRPAADSGERVPGRPPPMVRSRTRTSDHAVQCDLLDAPPLAKLLPAAPVRAANADAAPPPDDAPEVA